MTNETSHGAPLRASATEASVQQPYWRMVCVYLQSLVLPGVSTPFRNTWECSHPVSLRVCRVMHTPTLSKPPWLQTPHWEFSSPSAMVAGSGCCLSFPVGSPKWPTGLGPTQAAEVPPNSRAPAARVLGLRGWESHWGDSVPSCGKAQAHLRHKLKRGKW
jgi:hypothetical protein